MKYLPYPFDLLHISKKKAEGQWSQLVTAYGFLIPTTESGDTRCATMLAGV